MKILLLISILFYCLLANSANELIHEDSPYLKQHAYNPVKWLPWGDEALELAKREHKPIFLSIGYSTCHWCHVMARESFENKEIAKLLNDYFIPIKVDREEMPHLDIYYQELHIKLKKRSGGWPLSAFLDEDANPFFVGTYIPPKDTARFEGMMTLLPKMAKKYKYNRDKINRQTEAVSNIMNSKTETPHQSNINQESIFNSILKEYDDIYNGFSKRPKFPEASKVELLLYLSKSGNIKAKEMAQNVLTTMALSGIYDQVDGGFFRYSVDGAWEIPHFEKMLYNQAELLRVYLIAYKQEKNPLYLKIIEESVIQVQTRFANNGLFFSASNAESNHEEGGFFIYGLDEVNSAIDIVKDNVELKDALSLNKFGNFDNNKIHLHLYSNERPKGFYKFRDFLKELRKDREYPFIDKKINTAWNALMIRALFELSYLDNKYLFMAQKHLKNLLEKNYANKTLYHQSIGKNVPTQNALLEDYSFLISAYISAYEATYDKKYLNNAKSFLDEARKKFYIKEKWYLSQDDLKIGADIRDKYYSSALGVMILNLQKLSSLLESFELNEIANRSIKSVYHEFSLKQGDAPLLAMSYLNTLSEIVVLKNSKEKLIKSREKIASINYPALLTKADDTPLFLACKIGSCFSYSKNLDIVKTDIENLNKTNP